MAMMYLNPTPRELSPCLSTYLFDYLVRTL